MSALNGLWLIDKPAGMTSHDVVNRARRALGTKSVGHSGTLDPIASGLMVLLVGHGTRLSPYLTEGDKGYIVTAELGVETDTWDIEGKILNQISTDSLDLQKIESSVQALSGVLSLRVPSYSAVKVNGKKLYEYARRGEPVPEVTREMNFKSIKLIESSRKSVTVEMLVSKGTFVRSWVQELGKILGVGARVVELRRTFSSPYRLDQAITLDELDAVGLESKRGFIDLSDSLPSWPQYIVRGKWRDLIENGTIPNDMGWELRGLLGSDLEPRGIRILNAEDGRLLSLIVGAQPGNKLKLACVFK